MSAIYKDRAMTHESHEETLMSYATSVYRHRPLALSHTPLCTHIYRLLRTHLGTTLHAGSVVYIVNIVSHRMKTFCPSRCMLNLLRRPSWNVQIITPLSYNLVLKQATLHCTHRCVLRLRTLLLSCIINDIAKTARRHCYHWTHTHISLRKQWHTYLLIWLHHRSCV